MASLQGQVPLSFSVERLLQRSERIGSTSSSCEDNTTSAKPFSMQQFTPQNLVINAGFAAFPLPFNLPFSWNPAATTSTLNWNPLFRLQPVSSTLRPTSNTSLTVLQKNSSSISPDSKRIACKLRIEESDDEDTNDVLSSPELSEETLQDSMALGVEASSLQKKPSKSGYQKKKRTTFTSSQLQQLESRFNQQKYLTKHDRSNLAQKLELTEKHIKTWYQNRRTKWKKECTDEIWSRERESAAAVMYTQHLKFKSLSMNTSTDCTVF